MTDRTIQKAQAGLEDILVGTSTVSQTRGGSAVDITKINASELRVVGVYDFAVNAGGIGDIVLATLPDNAVVVKAWYEVITAFTSGGSATVALGIATDDAVGIKAALAFDNAGYDVDGLKACIQDGAIGNVSEKTTDIRSLIMTIATADLTAGKMYFWCDYIVSE